MWNINYLMDGRKISFGRGRFDKYCVYVGKQIGENAFKDGSIFGMLQNIDHNNDDIWEDICTIEKSINRKQPKVEDTQINLIKSITKKYDASIRLKIDYAFKNCCYGMVAEENKYTPNKKRFPAGKYIKKLGFYQSLQLDMDKENAAEFSVGKSWRGELKPLCEEYNLLPDDYEDNDENN
tara:strand:- start:205 stop:744 length:540 start_codon:yes stop_codon:yes gene_type:complete